MCGYKLYYNVRRTLCVSYCYPRLAVCLAAIFVLFTLRIGRIGLRNFLNNSYAGFINIMVLLKSIGIERGSFFGGKSNRCFGTIR